MKRRRYCRAANVALYNFLGEKRSISWLGTLRKGRGLLREEKCRWPATRISVLSERVCECRQLFLPRYSCFFPFRSFFLLFRRSFSWSFHFDDEKVIFLFFYSLFGSTSMKFVTWRWELYILYFWAVNYKLLVTNNLHFSYHHSLILLFLSHSLFLFQDEKKLII